MQFLIPLLLSFLIVVLAIVIIALVRAFTFGKKTNSASLNVDTQSVELDAMKMAEHLARVVQCETVSSLDPEAVDMAELDKLHKVLEEDFPLIHEKARKDRSQRPQSDLSMGRHNP